MAAMELLKGYGSGAEAEDSGSDSDDTSAPVPVAEKKQPRLKADVMRTRLNAAPDVVRFAEVATAVANPMAGGALALKSAAPGQQMMVYNPRAADVLGALEGPAHPHRREMAVPAGGRATRTGVIERTSMEDWSFHEQYHTFHTLGYATDTRGQMVGDLRKHEKRGGDTISSAGAEEIAREKKRAKAAGAGGGGGGAGSAADPSGKKGAKKGSGKGARGARAAPEDLGDKATHGIWAPETGPRRQTDYEAGTMTAEQAKFRAEWEAEQATKHREYNMEEDHDRRDERKISHLLPPRHNRDTAEAAVRSTFHGKAEQDYQGRSWVEPPAGAREGDLEHKAFTPKKCIHRWLGHSKGVQAIEFFPGYGHLILSGSMDTKVKIWDVSGDKGVRRTYHGHTAAVRDVKFSGDGRRFLSAGYDRFARLWDTETGQCVRTFTNRKMPYCVKFYPEDDNIFLAGCSDNKVVQWDATSGEVVQQYDHHLAPVNSVLFVDDNQRFVSTSDDKKVLIWEYGIPVPIKYIAEPHMHSMPATALHPSGGFWVGQSLDNQIVTWSARDKFRQLRKKVFKGHVNAGYACRMTFSPNGKFIASGDGEGKMYVWDWGSTKVYRKLECHDNGPCIDVAWHPVEPSWVATAGWDGVVKLWD